MGLQPVVHKGVAVDPEFQSIVQNVVAHSRYMPELLVGARNQRVVGDNAKHPFRRNYSVYVVSSCISHESPDFYLPRCSADSIAFRARYGIAVDRRVSWRRWSGGLADA